MYHPHLVSAQARHIRVSLRADLGVLGDIHPRLDRHSLIYLHNLLIQYAWTLNVQVEQVWTSLVADEEQVFEPLGHQQGAPLAFPLQQGVRPGVNGKIGNE